MNTEEELKLLHDKVHDLDKRMIVLETSDTFQKEVLTQINDNVKSLQKDIKRIEEVFNKKSGAQNLITSSLKVVGFMLMCASSAGIVDLILKYL